MSSPSWRNDIDVVRIAAGHNGVDPATAWRQPRARGQDLTLERSPDVTDDSHPSVPERYRAAARLLEHLADGDVEPSDTPAVLDAVYRHLAAAGR